MLSVFRIGVAALLVFGSQIVLCQESDPEQALANSIASFLGLIIGAAIALLAYNYLKKKK